MFVLRETNKDGSVNNRTYNTAEEAFKALDEETFKGAKNVCVMNERADTVLRIKLFEEHGFRVLSDGDIVSIKPEWRVKGEERYLYVVSNIHEEMERCLITCINGSTFIPSSQNVDLEMLVFMNTESPLQ